MVRWKVTVISFMVISLMFALSRRHTLLFAGLSYAKIDPKAVVGLWLFDEGKGDVAKDSSENGNDGTLKQGPKWVSGKFSKAIEFDGADDSVNVSDFHLPENNWSISSWVKRTGLGGIWISHNNTRAANNNLHLFFRGSNSGKPEIDYYNNDLVAKSVVDEGVWAHIVFVVEQNGNRKVYINAELDNEDANVVDYTGGTATLYMGLFFDCCQYKSLVDEVGIFNVALLEDEIKSIMTKGLKSIAAVSRAGKLTTVWGQIKK